MVLEGDGTIGSLDGVSTRVFGNSKGVVVVSSNGLEKPKKEHMQVNSAA